MAMPYSVESRRQRRMDASDIEPLVAAFVDHLSALGYASLTVICYEASARHFAHWLTRSRIDVADVDAVLTYLEKARPRVACDRIFFMSNAPVRPLTNSMVISNLVRGAVRKASIAGSSRITMWPCRSMVASQIARCRLSHS
jgi:hypothetical protein